MVPLHMLILDRHLKTFMLVNYVNYGKFEGYDENGQFTSEFTGSEIAISLGVRLQYHIRQFIGANAKLISST
jgi:hypothetical protein